MNQPELAHPEISVTEPARPLRSWERWLVPGILVGIALAQMVGTHFTALSPWKGGGFGMFSTVDGPGMRTLQAEGIDESGQILRLDVLGSLGGDLPEQLMAKPNLHDLGPMAEGLLEQEWVAMDAEEEYLSQMNREASAEGKQPAPDPSAMVPGLQATPPPVAAPASPGDAPLYRVRGPNDLAGIPTRYLRSVRLQWWRLRWDNQRTRLFTEPLGEEVRAGERGWPVE